MVAAWSVTRPALQSQKAVTAYCLSKQLLPFSFDGVVMAVLSILIYGR